MRRVVARPADERERGCIFFLHCLAQIEHKSPCRSGMGI